MEKEFIECEKCLKKPGSPVLCNSCLNNRNVISILKKENEKLETGLEVIKDIISLTKE